MTKPILNATKVLEKLYKAKDSMDLNHKVAIAPIEAQIKLIEDRLEVWFAKQGADKSQISNIVFVKKPRSRYNLVDAQKFWGWIKESPTGFTFFAAAVIQKEVKAFTDKHKVLPPGIKNDTWNDIKINLKK